MRFCLGMSESYLDDKCAAELLDWACGTGMGLQYIVSLYCNKKKKILQNAISVMMMECCLLHYPPRSMISYGLKVPSTIFDYTNKT